MHTELVLFLLIKVINDWSSLIDNIHDALNNWATNSYQEVTQNPMTLTL